jgi:transcriptional regulator with XRE-family HTH domain
MSLAADLIRETRGHAGLTQAELAERMSTSQAAIAQLEHPHSNPSVEKLERVLAAMGKRLRLETEPEPAGVDRTLLARQLKLPPAERLRQFEEGYEEVRKIALAGARARGEVA